MPMCERVRLRLKSQAVFLIISPDHFLREIFFMFRGVCRLSVLVLILLVITSGVLSGCSATSQNESHDLAMASLDTMPVEVKNAPVTVQQAYQFNAANPDVMTQIPCYCGCGAMGHTSNYSCYVSSVDEAGSITYDTHALGCSICVDISLDTMRMLKQGKAIPEIKAFIDQTYSPYGPSNMP